MPTHITPVVFISLLLGAFFLLPTTAGEVTRVRSIGVDGEQGIYTVACASGYRTTVNVFFREEPVRRCTYAYNGHGKATCRTTWNVDEAAAWACRKYR